MKRKNSIYKDVVYVVKSVESDLDEWYDGLMGIRIDDHRMQFPAKDFVNTLNVRWNLPIYEIDAKILKNRFMKIERKRDTMDMKSWNEFFSKYKKR